ncbi:hypothetical protein HGA91_06375 [candidate division WWE3 bacterium]|nr:hypothetical protein [candidate division WWE3 bacterium]
MATKIGPLTIKSLPEAIGPVVKFPSLNIIRMPDLKPVRSFSEASKLVLKDISKSIPGNS